MGVFLSFDEQKALLELQIYRQNFFIYFFAAAEAAKRAAERKREHKFEAVEREQERHLELAKIKSS